MAGMPVSLTKIWPFSARNKALPSLVSDLELFVFAAAAKWNVQ
jgi:hypothetical protein